MLEHVSLYIIDLIQSYGYVGVFILMTLESALIPIPSEITMPFAGFLVYRGIMSFELVVFIGAGANVVGSLIAYYIGYFFPEEVLLKWIRTYGKFLLIKEGDYKKSRAWFEKWGNGVAFFSRLLPGVRTFVSLPAGIFKINIWKFIIYTFVGSLIWSIILTYIGFYLGAQWTTIQIVFEKFHIAIILSAFVLVGYFVHHQLKK